MEGRLCNPIAVERLSKMKTKMNNFLGFSNFHIYSYLVINLATVGLNNLS